jgi:hydrogenase/urease accessory protein HupE
MAEMVYLACALTSLWCAVALMRTYTRRRTRVLLWTSLCFIGLALTNALLFFDLVVLPHIDLSLARSSIATAATLILAVGLIWDLD